MCRLHAARTKKHGDPGPVSSSWHKTREQRLLEAREIDENGCWIWPKAKTDHGYGRSSLGLVHRIAYEEFVGPIPDGLKVLHRCDVPPCFNPEHLFIGTCKDNTHDMMAKGRGWWQSVSH